MATYFEVYWSAAPIYYEQNQNKTWVEHLTTNVPPYNAPKKEFAYIFKTNLQNGVHISSFLIFVYQLPLNDPQDPIEIIANYLGFS